jgi:hypothetical protein
MSSSNDTVLWSIIIIRTYILFSGQVLIQKVPSSFIEFALNNVEQFTLARDHEDIDIKLSSQNNSTDEQWKKFIEQFYAASQ